MEEGEAAYLGPGSHRMRHRQRVFASVVWLCSVVPH